jgi:metallophosphoesterase superfamily enzyme
VEFPAASAESFALADGVVALAPGLAWLPQSRCILVADTHLAYEDVVGAALPLWSTADIVATLSMVAARAAAREIVFLGDIVHGAQMSEGAMRSVAAALDTLRADYELTLVAGNHEGRSRALRVIGATVEACERDGWLLVHGDRTPVLGRRAIIGHLHPSFYLAAHSSAPAFVASETLVVVPALTPYSPGLDVFSGSFAEAIGRYDLRSRDVHVVVATRERVYPFGTLAALREALRPPAAPAPQRYRRRRLGADR